MKNSFQTIIDSTNIFKHLDYVEIGTLDLNSQEVNVYGFSQSSEKNLPVMFDLASITKILTNGLVSFLSPDLSDECLKLCLEHQSGIPAWGLLSKYNWKDEILSFDVNSSSTNYSDYGAIRAMLIFEKLTGKNLYKEAQKIWDKEVVHWLDIGENYHFLKTGMRNKEIILGDVHDPNAFNIKEKLSHAGLFATSNGLLKTINSIFKKQAFCDLLLSSKKSKPSQRFHFGWDTPANEGSLAGEGFSTDTFGHLGFTGTSVWVDLKKKKAISILSNATRDGWYKKTELNKLRKATGTFFWNS